VINLNQLKLSGFADEIDEDLDIQLQSLNKLNLQYIEIRGINGKSITTFSLEEIEHIKLKLKESNIQVSALASPIGKIAITEPFSEHLALFKQTIKIAQLLDTTYIRLFSFYIPNGAYEEHQKEVILRMKTMVEIAEENKIILLHENEKDIYGDSPSRCLELIHQMNSEYFKATFDFANFVQCGYQPIKAYQLLKDHILYIHIKDANFRDKQVVLPGLGDGDILEILGEAITSGYKGFLSIEPHLSDFKGLEALELNNENKFTEENKGFEKFLLALIYLKKILKQLEVKDE